MTILGRRSLFSKLLWITLATTLVPLLVSGIYFLTRTHQALTESLWGKLTAYAQTTSSWIKASYFQHWQDCLGQIALLVQKNPNEAKQFLSSTGVENRCLEEAFKVYFENGFKVQALFERSKPSRYKELHGAYHQFFIDLFAKSDSLRGALWGSVFLGPDEQLYMLAGQRLPGPSDSKEGVVLLLNLNRVSNEIQGFMENLIRGEFRYFVFDKKGAVLSSSVAPELWSRSSAYHYLMTEPDALRSLKELQRLESETEGGDDLYVVMAPVAQTPWVVWLEANRRAYYAPLARMRFNFVGLFLFGLLVATLGALYYSKRITGPLKHFTRSATEIARGDFDQKVQVEGDDEIGRLARIFNYMVIELKRLNNMNLNQIISERAKTQAIIQHIADGVIVTDLDDRVLLVNAAIERWFRIDVNQIIGKPVGQVINHPEILQLLKTVRENQKVDVATGEFSLTLPGERKEFAFQARTTRFYDREGNLLGVITVLRDVTREKEIDRMKTDIVSMVAHELRSPLTSISGFSELLLESELGDPGAYEYAQIIKQESERLADLVNKFLDLSRIEAGKVDFHPEPLDLNLLIESNLYIATAEAEKKNIEIVLNLPKSPVMVKADERMVTQVFLNLLSNAIKYSDPNKVVNLRVIERESDVVVEVKDQGYGIPESDLPYIFNKFYRVRSRREGQQERGTGLGLTLVKEIVELHGGQVEVESQVGVGSTFRFTLPKVESSQEAEEKLESSHEVLRA